MKPDSKQTSQGGFTLVELLVVIAVIAVLAAVLLPALGRARASSDTAVCTSNLRQIAVALSLYVGDQEAYPKASFDYDPDISSEAAISPGWDALLTPYLGNNPFRGPPSGSDPRIRRSTPSVWICPSFARRQSRAWRGGYAYGYNRGGVSGPLATDSPRADGEGRPPRNSQLGLGGEVVLRPVKTVEDVRPIRDAEVANPADMIAAGDSGFGIFQVSPTQREPTGTANLSWGICHPSAVIPPDIRWLNKRHRGRWNTVFCDGHVTAMRTRDLFGFRIEDVRRRWNKDDEPHFEYAPLASYLTPATDPHNF